MNKYDSLKPFLQNQTEARLSMSFAQIEQICGTAVDHSFLQYKKELAEVGWAVAKIHMKAMSMDFVRIN